MFDAFHSKLTNIIDKHIPLKQMSKKEIKHLSKPWITTGIRVSLNVKNKIYKKFIKTRSPYYHNKFKLYRNKLNQLIRTNKIDYYNKYFNSNKTYIKNIWRGIKQIISLKPMSSNLLSKILKDDTELTDCKSIADAFNAYFSGIGNNLAALVPSVNKTAMEFMPPRQLHSFYLCSTTPKEIEEEIDKLNPSKATGPYSIPVRTLKVLKGLILKPLEIIFNVSLSTGVVPDSFKLASVIPIYKEASQINVSNYRPISLLSIFNRVLEKIMFKRLISFIDNAKILYNKQFGFRLKHSTLQAILSITDKIQGAIDDGNYSCGIFLDLSKAFDTVNHQILLKKLEHYGIRGRE